MSVVNKLLFAFGIPMYVVQDSMLTGAFKSRVSYITSEGTLGLANGVVMIGVARLYTKFGADRKIKQLDKATAKRLEDVIKKAYPEMADELL